MGREYPDVPVRIINIVEISSWERKSNEAEVMQEFQQRKMDATCLVRETPSSKRPTPASSLHKFPLGISHASAYPDQANRNEQGQPQFREPNSMLSKHSLKICEGVLL